MEWLKYLQIITFVLGWYDAAVKDGKINEAEISNAVTMVSLQFGVMLSPVEIQSLFSIIAKFRGERLEISL